MCCYGAHHFGIVEMCGRPFHEQFVCTRITPIRSDARLRWLVKTKSAFRSGTVDMLASKSMANEASITMQETFTDDFEGDFDPLSID
jgi:hypothetical protein